MTVKYFSFLETEAVASKFPLPRRKLDTSILRFEILFHNGNSL
ncbi:hypothetical protein CKA32_001640 [Geitlerinema sp. FC II]|nr:hypothetical protein CKA32_001640 [Geitlerinema sp. FC II]